MPLIGGDLIHMSLDGAIERRWQELRGAGGLLGSPISEENVTADGTGRYVHFEHGDIYWHPEHGAWEVSGTHLVEWNAQAGEAGHYGYPTGPVSDDGMLSGTQTFEHASIEAYIEPPSSAPDSDTGLLVKWEYEDDPLDNWDD